MSNELFTKFMGQDGQTSYRPSPVMAGYMAQDLLAFCAHCTQMHDDIGPDAYRAHCGDCGQDKVFGHLNFNLIA
jgi:hypothetical protein